MHACTHPCRLHQLLSDVVRGQKQPGYTVIHTGRNSWTLVIYSAAGVGLVYAYCRCVGDPAARKGSGSRLAQHTHMAQTQAAITLLYRSTLRHMRPFP